MDEKIIAVVGATGAQGGGLVRAIQADSENGFRARALTRNVDSEKAKALADLGAEVVAADIDDPKSLSRAFEGAHGVFGVTFFWDHLSPEREITQATNIAEASRQAGVRHVIWSTFEDTRDKIPLDDDRMPTLLDTYKVPHFDAKAEANRAFLERDLPTTLLLTSFYWDNLIHFGAGPRRGEDGQLLFVLPMGEKKLPGIAAEDIGRCVAGIFARGDSMVGQTVGIAGEHLTGAQMAAELSTALGQEVTHLAVPPEVYRTFDFPGAEELGNMFQYKADFEHDYCTARSVERSRELNPKLQTFAAWLEEHKEQIPIQ